MRYRRGLSTVVGAVFFIIATTTVVTYITYSMNSIDNFSQSVIVSESQSIDRGRESITISQVSIDGLKFNMTVTNTGSLPVKLTRLWVTNQDGVTADQKADLNIQLNPGQQQYNIGQSAGITADSAASYNLKIVTERGNISTFQVSPNTSTQIQLILPGEVQPGENFRVVTLITNNSTQPNNIADLVPIILNNGSLTQIDGPLPPSIKSLPQGNTAVFTSTYVAPSVSGGIGFNATYAGAPSNAIVNSNMTVALSAESEAATNSQWSQAASRVGILISGMPNPIDSDNSPGIGRFGIGIINPLDRSVYIYAISINTPGVSLINTPIDGIEPTSNWNPQALSGNKFVTWQGGSNPVEIPGKTVGQFRVTTSFANTAAIQENLLLIQALSSEGKLNAVYSLSSKGGSNFQTINMFYTNNTSSPTTNNQDWGYLVRNIKSGTVDQIFNATIENSSSNNFLSSIKLIILIPADFTSVGTGITLDIANTARGWGIPNVFTNLDGSTVINVETTIGCLTTCYVPPGPLVFQFKATAPTVTDTKLYVFQTTTVYPKWTIPDALQIASALTEAGVSVIP